MSSAEEVIQVKSEVHESSPASEALQLILQDSGLDTKSIMIDLTKLLNEDPNLTSVNPSRISLAPPTCNPPMLIPKRSQMNSFVVQSNEVNNMDMDETFSGPQTTSSSLGAYGGSSYGASPLGQTSPSIGWNTQVKQESDLFPNPGLHLSGGNAISLSPNSHGGNEYYNLQNAGPTLAQLNSPPNEDLVTLKAFGLSQMKKTLVMVAITGGNSYHYLNMMYRYMVLLKTFILTKEC